MVSGSGENGKSGSVSGYHFFCRRPEGDNDDDDEGNSEDCTWPGCCSSLELAWLSDSVAIGAIVVKRDSLSMC